MIEYNLLPHRLHPSIFALLPATEHDPPPCFSEQSASTDAPDIDINHADIPHRLAHLRRCLGGFGPVFVPHGTGSVLRPIGDDMMSRMLNGSEQQVS